MTKRSVRIAGVIVAIFLVLSPVHGDTVSAQIAELGCVANDITLTQAKARYSEQCTSPRADCDPHNGRWFCASFKMNTSTPAFVFTVAEPAQTPVTSVTIPPPSEPIVQPIPEPAPEPSNPWVPTTPIANESVTTPDIVDQSGVEQSGDDQNSSDQNQNEQAGNEKTEPEQNGNTNYKTPADITDLILVTGQSNALGASTSYHASLDQPHERVFAFTDQGWQVANLSQVWDLNWHPRNHPETDPSNNFAFHFGKRLAQTAPDRTVGFILVTAPGQAISHWRYQGDFYRKVESKVLDAINQLPHKSTIDGILWHQGESDGRDTQEYTDALYTLIYLLRTEPWMGSGKPFICGETAQLAVNNRLNGLNRDSDPKTACVRGSDLTTSADGHHFDAAALRTLGARYADAYRAMIGQ